MTTGDFLKKVGADVNKIADLDLSKEITIEDCVGIFRMLWATNTILMDKTKWHTGTPTEEGDYLVKLDVEHNVYPFYVLKWNKKGWYSHFDMDYPACPQHSVLKWQKIQGDSDSDIELDGRAEREQIKGLLIKKIRDRCEMERYRPEIKEQEKVCDECEMRCTCEILSIVQDIEGVFMSLKEQD